MEYIIGFPCLHGYCYSHFTKKHLFIAVGIVFVSCGTILQHSTLLLRWWQIFQQQDTSIFEVNSTKDFTARFPGHDTQISHMKEPSYTNPVKSNAPLNPATTKPRLILHVGPSKTATTSLQVDLTEVQAALENDRYSYAGRYYKPYTKDNGSFKLGRSESDLLTTAHNMLKHCSALPRSMCCRKFSEQLMSYPHKSQHQSNIILSEEPFGNQWRNNTDWEAIRQVVGEEWDVTVVIGYRRFYTWLPSARFQHERIDRKSKVWPALGGRRIQPFFPDWINIWHKSFAYSTEILDAVATSFPVQIINLHNDEQHSPLRELLCGILRGETPTACQVSIEREGNQTVMNQQSTVPSDYYDAIATAAADKGLVNITKWTRAAIWTAIHHRQEVELGKRPKDFALACPSQMELNDLLNLSLALEAQYMPDFAQHYHHLIEHRKGFHQYVERKAYCRVDTDTVLQDAGWKEFFKQFSL